MSLELIPPALRASDYVAPAHVDSARNLPRWAPPLQVNPTVYTLAGSFLAITAGPNEDVLVYGRPSATHASSVTVTGGRHVRFVGGKFAKTTTGATIKASGVTGSVSFEGIEVDASGYNGDAFNACGVTTGTLTYPDVFIQKCRIYGVNGTTATTHADLFQPQGPMGRLFVDLFTGSSSYQGFFIAPQAAIGAAFFSRCNLTKDPNATNPITYPLWFNDGSEAPYPVILDEVYVSLPAGQVLADSGVWPKAGTTGTSALSGKAIGAVDDGSGNATWPTVMQIDGKVYAGTPATGDFVPAGSVGIGYTAKGYQAAPAASAPPRLGWTPTKTAAYTAQAGEAVPVDTTGGTFAVTLAAPTAAGGSIRVKWVAGTVAPTVIAATGRTLDASAIAFTAVGDVVEFSDDGTTWQITSSKITTSTESRLGFCYTMPPHLATTAAASGAANRTYYMRLRGNKPGATAVNILVGTPSGNVSVGIYANNGLSGRSAAPGAAKATTGSVAVTATANSEQSIPLGSTITVVEGDWVGISVDNTTVTLGRPQANPINASAMTGLAAAQNTSFPVTTGTPASLFVSTPFWYAQVV